MSEPEPSRPPVLDYQRPTEEPARGLDEQPRAHLRVLAMIGGGLLLLAIVFFILQSLGPHCGGSRERARRVWCGSHLRQIGQAIALYANDNSGAYPLSLTLLVTDCNLSPDDLICPSSGDTKAAGPTTQVIVANLARPGHISYAYLGAGMSRSSVTPEMVIAHDRLENHDEEGINVLYGDGHVEWVAWHEAKRVLDELKAGHNPPRPAPVTTTRSVR